ncbi:MAG: peptide-binding protein [Rhodobacterales bacterium]|nr:MAG: peptide-binding protein [Rhodobacterales bacterium]
MIRLAGLVLLLALGPGSLRAETYPALHAVVGVAADDVLNIRAAPDAGADIVGTLAPNLMGVEVIAVSDGWAQVNSGEGMGYAAMRYLEREEGPEWFALARPLACFGTEPFWSLTLDPDARTAAFTTPEMTEPRTDPMGQTWTGEVWAPTAAVDLPDGMAVLRPAACSDGMSDQSFGIAVDLFLRTGDRQRISGCCTLAQR